MQRFWHYVFFRSLGATVLLISLLSSSPLLPAQVIPDKKPTRKPRQSLAPIVGATPSPGPVVSLQQPNGSAKEGFWALEPNPANDPTGQQRHGRLRAVPPLRQIGIPNGSGMPIYADWTSQQFDENALFHFTYDPNSSDFSNLPRVFNQNYYLSLTFLQDDSPLAFVDASGFWLFNPWYVTGSFFNVRSGAESYTAQFQGTINNLGFHELALDSNSLLRWTAPYGGGTIFRALFRYFQDGSQIAPLDEGEVALFQECNYQGKATVFVANTADFSKLTSAITTLDKTAASIRLGRNTAVTLHSAAAFAGSSQLIKTDTACLDGTPIGRQTTSIEVAPLLPIAIASKSCPGCDFVGIDFAGAGLADVDLTSADLTGAKLGKTTLTGTVLNSAKLNGADLTGAVFNGTKLLKTVLDGATGLSGADLSHDVVASGASLQGVNLTNAALSGAQLDAANLTGATLTGVKLQNTNLQRATLDKALGLPGTDFSLAQLQGASFHGANLTGIKLPQISTEIDLTGATITGVTLQNLTLDRAIFDQVVGLAGADLSQVAFSNASLRQTDLSGAKLYGANLNGANLEGSNLSGAFLTNNPAAGIAGAASLTGAYLKNVNLSNAQLSAANFTNASFYGTIPVGPNTCAIDELGFTKSCASASGATLNRSQFSGAYLYGVDFTNTTIQGVQFGNSVLVGANFTGAKLSTDPNLGSETGFEYAFLQGANLASATLTGTSLQGAFLDYTSAGNDLYMRIDGTHTTFPGSKMPGQAVCVFAYYTKPSTVPTNNTTVTCPDGSPAGAAGCGQTVASNRRWASLTDISQTNPPASYLQDATYTNKSAPVCSPPEQW